jgi:hypothetical protein
MSTSVTLSAFIVTLVVSYLIPLATALITKIDASVTLKQIVTAILAAVTGFLTQAISVDGTAVFSKESALFAILSFLTANVGYLYTWKSHDINATMLPRQGLG